MPRESKTVCLKTFETPSGAEKLRAAAGRLGLPLAEFLRTAAHAMAASIRPAVPPTRSDADAGR